MKSLIWKEFRLCWPILLVGIVLLVTPYMFYLLGLALVYPASVRVDWTGAAAVSVATSILTLTLLGGYAIACERADRSAEFLAYQPISRSKILASKLVWPLAAAVTIWSINLSVLFACGELSGNRAPDAYTTLGMFLAVGLVCFSIAWLVSAVQDSPTYAVGSGIMAPLAIGLCFAAVDWLAAWLTGDKLSSTRVVIADEVAHAFVFAYVAVILMVAVVSFIGGCWYYLRRVEP